MFFIKAKTQTPPTSWLYYVVLCSVLSLYACGDDGEIGPKGENGDTGIAGEKGDTGADGADGNDVVFTSGYFKGTVEVTTQAGETYNGTFDYQYMQDSLSDESFNSDNYEAIRFDSSLTHSPFIIVGISPEESGGEVTYEVSDFEFSYTQELSPTSVLLTTQSGAYDGEFTISNFLRDIDTGVVSFDFAYDGDADEGATLKIEASFNSGSQPYLRNDD